MITEDYVSFEVAKLLKEKGFDESTNCQYPVGGIHIGEVCEYNITDRSRNPEKYIPAPTLQMAMKWLRREHNLHCNSNYDIVLGWYCEITSLTETVEYDYLEMKHYHPDKDNCFSSPEEACEEAIKYCLENLI